MGEKGTLDTIFYGIRIYFSFTVISMLPVCPITSESYIAYDCSGSTLNVPAVAARYLLSESVECALDELPALCHDSAHVLWHGRRTLEYIMT